MLSVFAVSNAESDYNKNQLVKKINETAYNELIFDSAKAKFVGTEKPFFLTFINPGRESYPYKGKGDSIDKV